MVYNNHQFLRIPQLQPRTMHLSNILAAFLLASLVNQSMADFACECSPGTTLLSGKSFSHFILGPYTCSPPAQPPCSSNLSYLAVFKRECCVATASPTGAPNAASDWYLELDGDVTWSVSSFNLVGNLEITQKYKLAKGKAYTVTFLDRDCIASTSVPTKSVSEGVIDASYDSLTITSIISETNVVNSDLWTQAVGSSTARIDLCVRVDVVDGSGTTSYNFHEQKLSVTIDLTQGFTVTGVDVNRDNADTESTQTNSQVALTACKCNAAAECSSTPLVQGDAMFICIKPPANSPSVKVAAVNSLYYYQADSQGATPVFNASIVEGGTAKGGATEVTIAGATGIAIVKTQLPSVLFTPSNIDKNIYGSGTALIRFGSGQARNLRLAIDNSVHHIGGSTSRKMQDQTNETQTGLYFSIDLAPRAMEEAPQADANTGVIIGGIVGLLAGVAVIVALVLAARRKKEDDKDVVEAEADVCQSSIN